MVSETENVPEMSIKLIIIETRFNESKAQSKECKKRIDLLLVTNTKKSKNPKKLLDVQRIQNFYQNSLLVHYRTFKLLSKY